MRKNVEAKRCQDCGGRGKTLEVLCVPADYLNAGELLKWPSGMELWVVCRACRGNKYEE